MQRYGEAHEAAKRSIQINPGFSVSHSFVVASLVGLGRHRDALDAATRLLGIDPHFSVERFATTAGSNPVVFDHIARLWRDGGIP
jgi:hypothetical protein